MRCGTERLRHRLALSGLETVQCAPTLVAEGGGANSSWSGHDRRGDVLTSCPCRISYRGTYDLGRVGAWYPTGCVFYPQHNQASVKYVTDGSHSARSRSVIAGAWFER